MHSLSLAARATPARALVAVQQLGCPAPLLAVARAVRTAWRTESSLAAASVSAFVLSTALAPWTDWKPDGLRFHAVEACAMWAVGLLLTLMVTDLRRRRHHGPLTTARSWWRVSGGGAHAVRAFLALASLSLIVATFSGWKNLLGRDLPFVADPWLHAADVALHGGRTPAEWLAGLVARPDALRALDWWYYAGWTSVGYACAALLAWAPASRLRTRLLLTSALTWLILGTAAAYALPSAGPCFFGLVVPGADPYAWQTAALARMPGLTVAQVQASLWSLLQQHVRPADAVGGGISAMPSLHVASAAMTVLSARAFGGRRATAAALLMLVATMLGSVVLGMHYAVDGYVSILGVAAIWWGTGRLTPRPPTP